MTLHVFVSSHTGPLSYFPSLFLGFSLYVSNTTDNYQFYGKLCFKDKNFTTSTVPAVFNISCPSHGQYVIYYNERLESVSYPRDYSSYACNRLCEVEVYGDCFISCLHSSSFKIPNKLLNT